MSGAEANKRMEKVAIGPVDWLSIYGRLGLSLEYESLREKFPSVVADGDSVASVPVVKGVTLDGVIVLLREFGVVVNSVERQLNTYYAVASRDPKIMGSYAVRVNLSPKGGPIYRVAPLDPSGVLGRYVNPVVPPPKEGEIQEKRVPLLELPKDVYLKRGFREGRRLGVTLLESLLLVAGHFHATRVYLYGQHKVVCFGSWGPTGQVPQHYLREGALFLMDLSPDFNTPGMLVPVVES